MDNNIFIYNPTCDLAVENGTISYMAPVSLRKFEVDISPLMSLMASENDILLTENKDYQEFVEFWNKAGFNQPKYLSWNKINKLSKNYKVNPWGWSPVIAQRLKQFNIEYNFNNPETKLLFSRQTSLEILTEYLKLTLPFKHEISFQPVLPLKIVDLQPLEMLLNQYPDGIILKTLYSSSGRGLLFIRQKEEITRNQTWIEAKIKLHGYVIAEPIYNKVQDASLQFIVEKDNYHFLGLNYFDSDCKGKFQKEHIGTPEVIQSLLPKDETWIIETAQQVAQAMQNTCLHKKYNGPVGVDSIFLLDNNNQLKFHPLIEANLRCNMGLINMKLKERIHQGSIGTWQIEVFKTGKAKEFFSQQIKDHPVKIKDGKITEGFIPLSSYGENQQFAAWGLIHSNTNDSAIQE
ncbi:hypothetical protein [Carboxylicivirga caseinilyticus]|uniref:hypothetical protein n=1 Tax=Carboxylicivirga caseinilyticus TaxID=3417572 RepID=UPI003D32DE52|nr:hypothetical protein [Marinilabiliaceae bacterium A049]